MFIKLAELFNKNMNKKIILTAATFGFLAVVFGAFGAHSLKKLITIEQLEVWHTAVQYHFYHTLAILFLSNFSRFRNKIINFSFYCFSFGILFFSGSLYLISLINIIGIEFVSILGPITPIGGLFFILGWLSLFLAALRDK
jgi:uncharacterized membrane protein YgdD (TMEM256/DUF423 family)